MVDSEKEPPWGKGGAGEVGAGGNGLPLLPVPTFLRLEVFAVLGVSVTGVVVVVLVVDLTCAMAWSALLKDDMKSSMLMSGMD